MTYDATILATTGLTNYFKLGETSGSSTVADSQGSASGSVGTGVTLGNTGGVNDSSTCAYFPGANTSEYISLNQMLGPTGSMGSQDRSVEMWVNIPNRAATGNNNAMFCIGITNNYLDLWSSGSTSSNWYFGIYDPNLPGSNQNGSGVLLENTWYYVVYTFAHGVPTIFVNGIPYFQIANGSVAASTPAGNSRIGQGFTGDMFKGYIQKVAVYNVALSLATIQAHYTAGGGTVVDVRSAYNAKGGAVPIQRTVRATYNHQTQNVVTIQQTIKTGLPGGGSPRPSSGQMWPRGVAGR